MKNLWNVFLLLGLFICLASCGQPLPTNQEYSFTELNFILEDSIAVAFSLDTMYKPVSSALDCFDDGSTCHVFGNDVCRISMNYGPAHLKEDMYKSLVSTGEVKTMKIKDAYPAQQINKPKILKLGMLDGVMVETSSPSFNFIDYAGCNKEMNMCFDIKIHSTDTNLDIKHVLNSMVREEFGVIRGFQHMVKNKKRVCLGYHT